MQEFIVSNLDKYDLCDESIALTYWTYNRHNLVRCLFDIGFTDAWFNTDYVREICVMILSESKMIEQNRSKIYV